MKDAKNSMINQSVQINYDNLPEFILEIVEKLEELNKTGNWIEYDMNFDILDVHAKEFVMNKKMTESDYKKLLARYGWIYD